MLSQALKGAASSSCTSVGLASSQLSHSTSLLAESSSSGSQSLQDGLHISVDDGSVDTPKFAKDEAQECGEVEEEPFWSDIQDQDIQADQTQTPFGVGAQSSLDALCRSFVASNLTNRPLVHANSTNSSGMDIASTHNSSASPFPAMMARSCPKPIITPRRSRQGSLTTNQDELTVFIPPHELSLLDPASVSESLCRKGSAAIRLRSGVLRRTGYLEGHTETLRPQTSITSFRQ